MIEEFNKITYLDSGGNRCPFCQSENISAIGPIENNEDIQLTQIIQCDKCLKKWRDILTLTDIEEIED
jgi:hypothetical protein